MGWPCLKACYQILIINIRYEALKKSEINMLSMLTPQHTNAQYLTYNTHITQHGKYTRLQHCSHPMAFVVHAARAHVLYQRSNQKKHVGPRLYSSRESINRSHECTQQVEFVAVLPKIALDNKCVLTPTWNDICETLPDGAEPATLQPGDGRRVALHKQAARLRVAVPPFWSWRPAACCHDPHTTERPESGTADQL